MRDKACARALFSEKPASRSTAVMPISSALLHFVDFRSRNSANEKFLIVACRLRRQCVSTAAARGGSYAQKQLKSLLIFFCCSNPMSVPVDSRRHCTESPSTKLGGQQWRRRERKQRRRNRQRSVGRRSSLRRYRSSTFLFNAKIASHGPAGVDDGSTFIGAQAGQVTDGGRRRDGGSSFAIARFAVVKRTEKSNLPLAQMPAALILKTSRRSPRFVGGVFSKPSSASWSNPWRRFS
jgi:hypothetical protein